MINVKITLSFLLFFFTLCNSQIPGLINYSEKDGLNSSYNYMIKQDNKGFIWVGSDNGLFRFDGKEFKQYNKQNGLKNIDILSCEPLPNGEIFIIPFLNNFAYLKNDKIFNSDLNPELKKIQIKNHLSIIRNKNRLFLYDNNNSKNIYTYKNGKVEVISLPVSMNLVLDFNFHDNLIYFSNKKFQKIIAYDIIKHKQTLCNLSLGERRIFFSKNNILVTKTNTEIEVFKLENNFFYRKIFSYSLNENIHQAIIDKRNRLWICLENGGVLYFDTYNNFHPPVKFLDDYMINDVYTDIDNNIWFSTRNNGIFFLAHKFFKNYISLPVKNNSSAITAITNNDKTIFLGYNRSEGAILSRNGITNIVLENNKKTENKIIYANNKLIIFGLSNKIFLYNIDNHKTFALRDCSLKNIIPYTDHSVLICEMLGLLVYDFTKNTYTDLIKNERVYTALPYTTDSIFVGNFNDLYKFNSITKEKKLFLEGYYFTDIKKLKHNLYIGATNLNGIIFFNNNKILKKITEKDGLSSGQIKKIEIQNENVFWASTNSGLNRIELKGNTFKINNFTQTDGLPSNIVAGCVIKKDTIYIGTSKGLGIFSIKELLAQEKFINKKVIINSITISGKEYFDLNTGLIGQTPNNDVVFNVSFPDYLSQGIISYKYKIEGLNDMWRVSNSSKIILNSLPPGKYVFKIFGLGYNGKQSLTFTAVPFEIKPIFWQTWWFRALLIIIIFSVLTAIITWHFQKKRNKKIETFFYEKKIAELELQAIKAQINPHFIYNCLNSIQFLLYKKDYSETENYLDIFSQMIRKTLFYSEKTFMPIKEETEYLSLYLNMEKLRLKEEFDYEIIISENVDPEWIIPSLLIQPFVENSIKHGVSNLKDRKGNIRISFNYEDFILCITIEDNGIGFSNQSELINKKNSFGVKLSKKRIDTFKQLFNTDITLEINNLSEKQEQSGTQIKIYITPYENKNPGLHH